MNIYVASSWRNERQPEVVKALGEAGHDVYDFRNPEQGKGVFHWSDIDPDWKSWTPEEFRHRLLTHHLAWAGYSTDMNAMWKADACVLVMPCGRSAHLEAGWFVGSRRHLIILLSDGEPELMYRMATICVSLNEVIAKLSELGRM